MNLSDGLMQMFQFESGFEKEHPKPEWGALRSCLLEAREPGWFLLEKRITHVIFVSANTSLPCASRSISIGGCLCRIIDAASASIL